MITGVGTRIWPDFEQTMLLASSIALLQISLIVPVWKPSSPVPIESNVLVIVSHEP